MEKWLITMALRQTIVWAGAAAADSDFYPKSAERRTYVNATYREIQQGGKFYGYTMEIS